MFETIHDEIRDRIVLVPKLDTIATEFKAIAVFRIEINYTNIPAFVEYLYNCYERLWIYKSESVQFAVDLAIDKRMPRLLCNADCNAFQKTKDVEQL